MGPLHLWVTLLAPSRFMLVGNLAQSPDEQHHGSAIPGGSFVSPAPLIPPLICTDGDFTLPLLYPCHCPAQPCPPHLPRGRLVGWGSFVNALILTCAQPDKAASPRPRPRSRIRNVPCPIDCRARSGCRRSAAPPARARLLWQAHPSFRDGGRRHRRVGDGCLGLGVWD